MKKLYSLILCMFFLALFGKAIAQQYKTEQELRDALAKNLPDTTQARLEAELSWMIKFTATQEALERAQHVIKKGYQRKQANLLMLGYRTLGITHVMLKKRNLALHYYDSCAHYARKTANLNFESQAYSLMAGMYGDLGDYNKSIEFYTLAKRIAMQSKNNNLIASTCNNLADAYQHTNRNTSLVQHNFKLAMMYALQDADSGKACLAAANLSKEFSNNKQFDSMHHYMMMASKIFDLKESNPYHVGAVYSELANVYASLNKPSQVIAYASRARVIFDSLQRPDNVLIPLAMIMQAHFNLQHDDESEKIAHELLVLAKTRDAKLYLRDAYKTLSDVAKRKQRYAEALDYYEHYTFWNDSIFSIARDQSISAVEEKTRIAQTEFETKLKTEQKEKQNSYLTKLNRALQQQKWIAIITSALLLLSFVLLWIAYRRRNKLHAQLLEEKHMVDAQAREMEVLMGEIHHRVKNNLTMLQSLLFLQARSSTNEETKRLLLESQSRIHSMALVHKNLYGEKEKGKLKFPEFVENLLSELATTFRANSKDVDITVEGQCRELTIETAIPLALMMNELATNSFKYAFENKQGGRIAVHIEEKEQQIYFTYSDNGKGLPQGVDLQHGGFGFKMLSILANQMNATLSYRYQDGAMFTINLPIS